MSAGKGWTAVQRLDEALDVLMQAPAGKLPGAWQRVREAQQDVKVYLRFIAEQKRQGEVDGAEDV